MFCNKCGKELSDNATFCSGCGSQVGAAPAAAPAAANSSLPPILSRLISQITNFFTKKDPAGVVANSAKDNSFSGAILAIFGILMFAVSAMVNVNQGIISYAKAMYEDDWSNKISKEIAKNFPSGTSFGMFLLLAVVVFAAAAIMTYVFTNNVVKKQISFSGAINLVAYASLPMIVVSVLNMILGLIWFALPVFFMLLAVLFTLAVMGSALDKVTGGEKSLTVKIAVIGVTVVVALIFLWIALRNIEYIDKKSWDILTSYNGKYGKNGAISSYIENFFFRKN